MKISEAIEANLYYWNSWDSTESGGRIEATPEFNKANKATDGRIVAIYDPNTRTAGYKVGTGKRPRDSHLFDVEGPTFYTDTAAYLDTTAKLYGGSKSAEAPRGYLGRQIEAGPR